MAVLVLGAILTQRGWPTNNGTLTVSGLHRPVTVQRDRSGIIQITAEDRHDLFLAQGYSHAQERMWQMEISRRIGAGRLAELFGKGQVDTDTYIRTLGWRVAAARDLAAMSPESIAILQAYADGVNAWIKEHDGQLSTPFVVAGLLSGSGGLGGITLEPWTPLDTATWQKVQAWSLGGNVDTEIFRLLADARLGSAARTDELFPGILPLEPYFDPAAQPVAGADGSINNNYARISRAYPDPDDPDYVPLGITEIFGVTNGPSYRLTVDMSDLDGARIIITTGQSGNPFDQHYGDLIPLWIAGDTIPLPFSATNVAASAVQTLTLSPP